MTCKDIKHLHEKDLNNLKEYRIKYNALILTLETEFSYYDVAFTKHKDMDDFKIAQVLSKIIRGSK